MGTLETCLSFLFLLTIAFIECANSAITQAECAKIQDKLIEIPLPGKFSLFPEGDKCVSPEAGVCLPTLDCQSGIICVMGGEENSETPCTAENYKAAMYDGVKKVKAAAEELENVLDGVPRTLDLSKQEAEKPAGMFCVCKVPKSKNNANTTIIGSAGLLIFGVIIRIFI